MNKFVNAMQNENNYTYTENGALALKSTNSSIVDLFGTIGSLRTRNDGEIERLFAKAFAEDALLATKMSFYARNIRGGLGERRTPKVIWKYLAQSRPDVVRKNLVYIPQFGRWDDLFVFEGTPVEADMWDLIKSQFQADLKVLAAGKGSMSLMPKWLKSVNASNKDTIRLAKKTARTLGLSDKEYRQKLSAMRAYLDVVEVKMSAQEWDKIKYAGVTSRAMKLYRNAFSNHDAMGFEAYKESLVKGETKVNASTLFPYDIMETYGLRESGGWRDSYLQMSKPYDVILEEQWKALPNYVEGENNVLVMADTSGSMSGRPLASAVGLAMYFAERNKGAFKDVFLTFSNNPKFVTLKGNSLYDKVKSVEAIVANTDIERAFKLILDTAVKNNVPAEDMPKSLVIISDMEFDSQTTGNHNLYYDRMVEMYHNAGYEVPTIIFWNVDSRQDTFHVACDKKGVQLASGQSASTFKTIMANIGKTPLEAVIATLNSETYSMITV